MTSSLLAFKQILIQVAYREGVSLTVLFKSHGLNDFLQQVTAPADSAQVIAAKALLHFCVEEGQFNGFVAGVKAVVQFLDEQLQAPATAAARGQALTELQQVLTRQGTYESLLDWVNAHYQ